MSELPLNSEEAFEAALSPPKFQIILPVMIDSANGVIEGYVDEMNEIEMRIVSLTHLPNLGEKCKVSFLLDQVTRAYAKVIGVDSVNRRFDMEISRFIENGQYILAILSKDVQDDNKR